VRDELGFSVIILCFQRRQDASGQSEHGRRCRGIVDAGPRRGTNFPFRMRFVPRTGQRSGPVRKKENKEKAAKGWGVFFETEPDEAEGREPT